MKKSFILKIIMGTLLSCLLVLWKVEIPLMAAENEEDVMRDICSQEEYQQYTLKWQYNDESLFDLLEELSIAGETVAEYEYNENFLRVKKSVDGIITYFTYDDNCTLVKVQQGDCIIEYLYDFVEDSNSTFIKGFVYEGIEYDFVYENRIIVGISLEGELIAKYVYGDFYSFYETQSLVDGEWRTCTDEGFVGNLNKIRYVQAYYEDETGWYYMGRYYDPLQVRYIDGISPEVAEALTEKYGYKGTVKSYRFALPYTGIVFYNTEDAAWQEEVVARVIYAEAERIYSSGANDGVLTPSVRVNYITDQLNFRSINNFIDKYSCDGSSQCYLLINEDGSSSWKSIHNVAVPGVALMGNNYLTEVVNNWGYLHGTYNIYFSFEGE